MDYWKRKKCIYLMVKLFQVKNTENEIIKFEQLTIDLSNLVTTTIKKPKYKKRQRINF